MPRIKHDYKWVSGVEIEDAHGDPIKHLQINYAEVEPYFISFWPGNRFRGVRVSKIRYEDGFLYWRASRKISKWRRIGIGAIEYIRFSLAPAAPIAEQFIEF